VDFDGDNAVAPDAALGTKRKRRTKARRKRREAAVPWRYYLGGVGAFGWVLAGLFVAWVASVAYAVVTPGLGGTLMLAGNGLVLVGNIWVGLIAFRDHHTYGMLCFFTCLFTYVYIIMNLEETWRPASLTALGFLFMAAALVIP
jgi:hypothetical protein